MNPQTVEEAQKIFAGIKRAVLKTKSVDVVVCPPFTYIQLFSKKVQSPLHVGAQDVFWEEAGSFTGQVSAQMLLSSGCEYVIVGHSERRALGETNEMVAKKVIAAYSKNLIPIVCVGEKARDDQGEYLGFLRQQITESLAGVSKRMIKDVVIAYEPVWAIGKSYSMAESASDMQEISIFIKKVLADMFGKEETDSVKVLYGGSVAPVNAEDIALHGNIDGFLVGRQSLDVSHFAEIIRMVAEAR